MKKRVRRQEKKKMVKEKIGWNSNKKSKELRE